MADRETTLDEIVAYLDGSSTLDGYWFGEGPAGRRYWWRSHLRAHVERLTRERDEAREALRERDEILERNALLSRISQRLSPRYNGVPTPEPTARP